MAEFTEERLDDDDVPGAARATGAGAAPEVNAAAGAMGATTTTTTNGHAFAAAPEIANLMEYASMFDTVSGVSEQGHKFIEQLCNELNNPMKKASKTYWADIRVMNLSQPNDTLAVVDHGWAVILIMAESNLSIDDYPVAHLSKLAASNLGTIVPGVQIIETIVITPDDYPRADKFASYIRSLFVAMLKPGKATVASVGASNLTFSENPRDYEAALAQLSPHGVPLKADLCLTIYHQLRQQYNYNQQNIWAPENEDYWKSAEGQSRRVLATVGCNLEFIKSNPLATDYKYTVRFHISDINSSILANELIPVFIVIAVKKFVLSDAWKMWLRSNPVNAHGERINVGYLFPDGNGGRSDVKTDEAFNTIMQMQFDGVEVVLDVVEGRARLPGLWKFVSSDRNTIDSVLGDFANFFGGNIEPYQGAVPYMLNDGATQYRGVYMFGNKTLDTANIDFFGEYPRHNQDIAKCEKLLFKKLNPLQAIQEQKAFEPDLKVLYSSDSVSITPDFYGWMNRNMPILNNLYTMQGNGMANTAGTVSNAAAWNQFVRQGQYQYNTNNGGGYFNRFDPVYGNPWGNN